VKIYFVTGNENKFKEAQSVIAEIERLDVDLPEIQSLDSQEIIEAKLKEVMAHHEGVFIVEDVSLTIKGMGGLPGPLIKWFLKSVGKEGVVKLAGVFGSEAVAKVVVGYKAENKEIKYFEGVVEGDVVESRGDKGFGWDAIFRPKGSEKTFGEMELEEKNEFSMRRMALEKLKKEMSGK